MNHYLFLLSSEWSLPPISPLQNQAVGWMLDTSKHRHLCARCAAPRIHGAPPEPFTELTAATLRGVRQTMCCRVKERHDAFSCRGPEYLPTQRGQEQESAVGVMLLWELSGDDGTSGCNSCRPELHSLGYQINELPRLWVLFAGDVRGCVGSPTQLQ